MDQETSREWHFIPTPGSPKMGDRAVLHWAGCVPGWVGTASPQGCQWLLNCFPSASRHGTAASAVGCTGSCCQLLHCQQTWGKDMWAAQGQNSLLGGPYLLMGSAFFCLPTLANLYSNLRFQS